MLSAGEKFRIHSESNGDMEGFSAEGATSRFGFSESTPTALLRLNSNEETEVTQSFCRKSRGDETGEMVVKIT